MNKQPFVSRSIRPLAAGALALMLSAPLFAQQADEEPTTETIVVTGSRIGRVSDFGNSSPVDIISRDGIEKAGYANLQQLMEKLPSNGNGAFSSRGNNQDSTANGAASISLRGLGADATLVLVNGRRVAISPFAESITTNFVDINSIPVSAIERVEVLKDGASALYGSDAVAGVINIILRKDFEGLELSGGVRQTTESGYDEQNYSAVWGFGGEDNNVTFIFDYFKNSTLVEHRARNARDGEPDGARRPGFPLFARLSRPLHVNGVNHARSGVPGRTASAGATCVYDFGTGIF